MKGVGTNVDVGRLAKKADVGDGDVGAGEAGGATVEVVLLNDDAVLIVGETEEGGDVRGQARESKQRKEDAYLESVDDCVADIGDVWKEEQQGEGAGCDEER